MTQSLDRNRCTAEASRDLVCPQATSGKARAQNSGDTQKQHQRAVGTFRDAQATLGETQALGDERSCREGAACRGHSEPLERAEGRKTARP